MEHPLNVTLLGELVGYKITSLELLVNAFSDLARNLKNADQAVIHEKVGLLTQEAIFSLLLSDSQSERLCEAVSELLKIYFDSLPSQFLLAEEFKIYLKSGLESSHPSVKILTLEQLLRIPYNQEIPFDLITLNQIFENINHDDVAVSTKASQLIEALTIEDGNLKKLLDTEDITRRLKRLSKSPISKIRSLELLLNILLKNETSFQFRLDLLRQKELFNLIFPTFPTAQQDLLLRLNLVELYIRYTPDPKFQKLLLENNVLETILASYQFDNIDRINQLDSLTLTSDLKLLAEANSHLVQSQEVTNLAFAITSLMYKLLDKEVSVEIKIPCLKAMATMAQTSHGVLLMANHLGLFKRMAYTFFHLVGDPKAIGLDCLSAVFGVSKEPSNQVSGACELLFGFLQEYLKLPYDFLRFAMNPNKEIKIPAYRLLYHISLHPFGIEALINDNKTMEKLLDRSTESEFEGLKWKYSILSNVLKKGTHNVLPIDLKMKIENYLRQGIAYQESVPRVDLDMA